MQHIDVTKKRPARWPWLLGAGLLVLTIWGVTILLRPDPDPEPQAAATTAADTLPPAMIPSDTRGSVPARSPGAGQNDSLSEDRVGERVRLDGEVVATGPAVFWFLTGSHVVRVDSPRQVRAGESISVQGTVREADEAGEPLPGEATERYPDSDRWTVLHALKIVEDQANGDAEEVRGG